MSGTFPCSLPDQQQQPCIDMGKREFINNPLKLSMPFGTGPVGIFILVHPDQMDES